MSIYCSQNLYMCSLSSQQNNNNTVIKATTKRLFYPSWVFLSAITNVSLISTQSK